jgi:bifunctional DNA-binding transcriptional regulator/antitoxin component of YhaV-PrlF toxin-antitoxin module
MDGFRVKVDGSGRILLPVKVRKQLKLQQGSVIIARLDKEQIVLKSQAQALREVQEYFSRFRKKCDKLWSDELIEDRREEARRELED